MRDLVRLCLWLTVLVVPLENMVMLSGIGSISRLLGAITFTLGVLAVAQAGHIRRMTTFHTVLAWFMLWGSVNLLWSVSPEDTLPRIWTYLQLAALVWLLWEFIDTMPQCRALMLAYVLGAWVSLVDTVLAFQAGHEVTYLRYAAEGFDPNDLGLILALGIPMAWYLALTDRMRLVRLVGGVYVPLAAYAVLLTASRGAFLATIVASLFVFWSIPRLSNALRWGGVVVILVLIGALATLAPSSSTERLATIQSEVSGGDLNERLTIWQAGIHVYRDHALLGIGTGAFGQAVAPEVGDDYIAHNTYLSVLVERGAIGFILFVGLLLLAVWQVLRMPYLERGCWLVIFLTWCVGALGLSFDHRKPTWLMFAMLIGQAALTPQSVSKSAPAPRAKTTSLSGSG